MVSLQFVYMAGHVTRIFVANTGADHILQTSCFLRAPLLRGLSWGFRRWLSLFERFSTPRRFCGGPMACESPASNV